MTSVRQALRCVLQKSDIREPPCFWHRRGLNGYDFFPRVVSPRAAGPGGLDGLTIDAAGTGFRLFPGLSSNLPTQVIVNPLPESAAAPAMEVVPHGPFRRKILGQGVPRTSVGQDIEDGIEDLAEVGGPWCSGWHRGRQHRLQDRPLGVTQVTGVGRARWGVHAANSGFLVSIPAAVNPNTQPLSRRTALPRSL